MAWVELVPRVSGLLRSVGVPADDVDDVVSDTFERVVKYAPAFDTAEDLWPWVATVARRRWIDVVRHRREKLVDEVADEPGWDDVPTVIEARAAWARVVERFPELRPFDQQVLRQAAIGEVTATSSKEAQRERVRLHRARNRLRDMLEGLAAVVGGAVVRIRVWMDRQPAALTAIAAVAVLAFNGAMPAVATQPTTRIGARAGIGAQQVVPASRSASPQPSEPLLATAAARPTERRTTMLPDRPSTSMTHPSAAPPVVVAIPTPLGEGHYRTRPDRDGDHLACVRAGPLGNRCFDGDVPAPPQP